jgi:hypothetical protein
MSHTNMNEYKINALDIETYTDENGKIIPFCICSIINNNFINEYYEENTDIIIKYLLILFNITHKKSIVYIHNIDFDGCIIIESLSKQKEIKFDVLIRDTSIYSIKMWKNYKEIVFKCSYKLVPKSLNSIAKVFKIGKKMTFPHLFSNKENLFYLGDLPNAKYFYNYEDRNDIICENGLFNFKEYALKYCTNDVIITSKFMEIFKKNVEIYGINIDKIYSAPSLSLKIFIEKYNNNVLSFKIKKSEKDLLRNSYFGGRCEVYGNPKKNEHLVHFDFSGMYGQCMLEKFPFGKTYIENNPQNYKRPGFYYIEYLSNMNIPVLPHRSKLNNKLMFVNGNNKGLFWFEEILLFEKMGGVIKNIEIGIIYDKYDYIFKNFIDDFTKLRKENEILNIFGKLIINSLYGRMGMDDIKNEKIIIHMNDFNNIDKKEEINSYKVINDYVIVDIQNKEEKKVKSNISIASAITSKARIKLYNAQQDVILNEGRLLYSDTDSIYASYNRDVKNEIHGVVDWSADKNIINDAVFLSSKTYGVKYKNGLESIKIKGFDNKHLNFDELKNNFYSEEIDIKIKENTYISKKNMEMFNIKNIKKLSLKNYDKRKFINNFKNTEPLFLNNYILYN